MQITVEYGSGNVDDFIAMADAIEDRFPDLVVEGEETEEYADSFVVRTETGETLLFGEVRDVSSERVIAALEDAGLV